MSSFIKEGNLGHDPSLKYVSVKLKAGGTEQRPLVEMNVRFDVQRLIDGEYKDVHGFWAKVKVWGKRAEYLHTHLKKGCRILVVGELSQHPYIVQTGERKGQDATSLEIDAEHVGLVLLGVDQITFSERKTRVNDGAAPVPAEEFIPAEPYEFGYPQDSGDHIPFDR